MMDELNMLTATPQAQDRAPDEFPKTDPVRGFSDHEKHGEVQRHHPISPPPFIPPQAPVEHRMQAQKSRASLRG